MTDPRFEIKLAALARDLRDLGLPEDDVRYELDRSARAGKIRAEVVPAETLRGAVPPEHEEDA